MCQSRCYVEECQASLTDEETEEEEFNFFYHRLVQDVHDHFRSYYMHAGRESHVHSDGEPSKCV